MNSRSRHITDVIGVFKVWPQSREETNIIYAVYAGFDPRTGELHAISMLDSNQ